MGAIAQSPSEQIWDKHAIKAAICRKGKSLAALARDHQMPESSLRSALVKPTKEAELVISQFLEKPLFELFPERWTEDNKRIYPRYNKSDCK
ncbi:MULTISPECIES: helix-turn-helix domain-containing protein [unclassified Acinetobacter]|uniref:helix-turn-helix domain-containing protein n=1 Tax=unclassified Acinetobacter TaxID=196816 RepID=UPI00190DCB75|nr:MULTISPECIES: helix-turn-helix domain-containing protein [unclassified Acinetobacter]MBK0062417.1 helix-turn-helix domain-containing protein [Acinetobacter sp. S55]MBK0066221.1 helix-turn-helix domain-containing protein [Acinetobacter sp. S54]